MTHNVVVLDYGCGNKKSLLNAFERIGIRASLSHNIDIIKQADRIVLPGVGAFDQVMRGIEKIGCKEALITPHANQKILGICIGMHVLCNESDEGSLPGLGIFNTRVTRLDESSTYLLPNVGWGTVEITESYNRKYLGIQDKEFYFDHSYSVASANEYVTGRSKHSRNFCSFITSGKHIGVQFHPERSHDQGLAFLENFCA